LIFEVISLTKETRLSGSQVNSINSFQLVRMKVKKVLG